MIVVKCRVHGDLTEEKAWMYFDIKADKHRYRCKKCLDERQKKTLQNHIDNGFVMPRDPQGSCKKHGKLNLDIGFICVDKKLPNGYRLRCKECTHRIRVRNYIKNPEKYIKNASVWKSENRYRINEQVRQDRIDNPEKYKKWSEDHYKRNRDNLSIKKSLKERKIDKDFYDKMLKEQDNLCAICDLAERRMARNSEQPTRLCIDHDHETGTVRQLLCHDCNTALGKMKDSPELLLKAADYLIKHKGWTI